jgi:hypothetical protein
MLDSGLGDDPPPVPVALLAQARMAARAEVGLETVLRRYAAGHSLLTDGVLEEAASLQLSPTLIRSVLRGLGLRYDRIVAAVSEEYERETAAEPSDRRSTLLRRLLDGEPLDTGALGYPFDGHHLAIVASGPGIVAALPALGERLDRHLLLGEPDPHTTWAWLGGRRPFECDDFELFAVHPWPQGSAVACGEPGEGPSGWRLSHRQAAAALPVAERVGHTFVLYADVSLLAAVLQDDLLAASLPRCARPILIRSPADARPAPPPRRPCAPASKRLGIFPPPPPCSGSAAAPSPVVLPPSRRASALPSTRSPPSSRSPFASISSTEACLPAISTGTMIRCAIAFDLRSAWVA